MLGKPRIYLFSKTRLINSIKHEHLYKILYFINSRYAIILLDVVMVDVRRSVYSVTIIKIVKTILMKIVVCLFLLLTLYFSYHISEQSH